MNGLAKEGTKFTRFYSGSTAELAAFDWKIE